MAECEQKIVTLPDEYLPEVSELPSEDLQRVAEIVGVSKTLELVEAFRGTYVYFRNLDHLERQKRNKAMREEFDRRTAQGKETATRVVKELARRVGLSERQVWDIINAPDERQLGLWGS